MPDDQTLRAASLEVKDAFGDNVYVFAPSDSRYFFGEEILLFAAGTILTAFFKGLTASLQGEIEAWGRSTGNWIAARIKMRTSTTAGLAATEPTEDPELLAAVKEAREALVSSTSANDALREARVALEQLLYERGVTATEAERIARQVSSAATSAL